MKQHLSFYRLVKTDLRLRLDLRLCQSGVYFKFPTIHMPNFRVKYSYWMVYAPNKEQALKRALEDIRKDLEKIVSVEKYKKKRPPLWRLLVLGK